MELANQIINRLLLDQFKESSGLDHGMFGKNRPDNERRAVDSSKGDVEAYMTFYAVRTIKMLKIKHKVVDQSFQKSLDWAENVLSRTKDNMLYKEIPDENIPNRNKKRVDTRHTLGLACILLIGNRRPSYITNIINFILECDQLSNGGWERYVGTKKTYHSTNIWFVTFFNLVLKDDYYNHFFPQIRHLLKNTIQYFEDDREDDGTWGYIEKQLDKVYSVPIYLTELKGLLKEETVNNAILFLLEHIKLNNGELFFSNYLKELSSDEKYKYLLKICYVLSIHFDIVKTDKGYTKLFYTLRDYVINDYSINVGLNTTDLCNLLLLYCEHILNPDQTTLYIALDVINNTIDESYSNIFHCESDNSQKFFYQPLM